MTNFLLSNVTVGLSEFKNNPMQAVSHVHGEPLAILNRNKVAFYCLAPETYENMMDRLEEIEIKTLLKERENDEEIEVDLYDL